MQNDVSQFHAGEISAQHLAGVPEVASWANALIRPYMPQQHRDFFSQLPFLVVAGADAQGHTWVTLLDGPDGFIASPDDRTLTVSAAPRQDDPLAHVIAAGTGIGVLGIDLATRRRNRLSGVLRRSGAGHVIDVRQSFGNCPQYIHERSWTRVEAVQAPAALRSDRLSVAQIDKIRQADTLFLGTGHAVTPDKVSSGFDASHRGGPAGFVQVKDSTHLRLPDYPGNNFFNSIGNLLVNPRIGLVFVDFQTGGLLHISGRARIDWNAENSEDPQALRFIDIDIEAVVERPQALGLRWEEDRAEVRDLVVVKKVAETTDVTSFHLAAADGKPLDGFAAGQHLPIEIESPDGAESLRRSYSLSGAPTAAQYRISVKREPQGRVSRYLHDELSVGDTIRARRPSGDFTSPRGDSPLVLVSAGVGATPMIAILTALAGRATDRLLWYVHGTRNGATHAFKAEVDALARSRTTIASVTHYSQPRETEQIDRDYDAVGRISAASLVELGAGSGAQYLLCGPASFIADITSGLEAAGVAPSDIHFETFGPAS